MPERGFSTEGREEKTVNQICRLGKCCTGLGSYHVRPAGNPILIESVFRGIGTGRGTSFSRIHVASSHL